MTWESARAQENNFRRKLGEFTAEDCTDLERLKLIECSGARASSDAHVLGGRCPG